MTYEVKRSKKKDDELSIWLIVGGLFTLTLIGVDIFYSSLNEMERIAKVAIYVLHFALMASWATVLIGFNNPNYEWARRVACVLAVALILWVGIHHATSREDKQVIIDSHENAVKP